MTRFESTENSQRVKEYNLKQVLEEVLGVQSRGLSSFIGSIIFS